MIRPRWLLLAVCLLAFALRVYRLDFQSIWVDEGFVADLAGRNLGELVDVWNISPQESYATLSRLGTDLVGLAAETDIHPPLYYFLLHFWILLAGSNEFALRFPAAFFGLLTVPLLFVVGKRLAGTMAAFLASALASFSPFYLDFSQQVRMYTLATSLVLLAMYSFHRGFQEGRRSWWIVHSLAIALAIYTHYFAVTVVLVQAFLVAANIARGKRPDSWKLWLASQFGALILLAPWAPFALRQMLDYRNRSLLSPDWLTVFPRTWQAFNLGLAVDSAKMTPVLLVLLVILVAGLALAWLVRGRETPGLAALMLYLVLPVLVGLAIFRFKPMFHPKYFMMASPAYLLLLAASLMGFWRSIRWVALIPGLFVLFSVSYAVQAYYTDQRYWKDDTRAVARYLADKVTQEDLIISDLAEPLGYYYKGKAPAYYMPGEEATAPLRLASLAGGRQIVYLLHYEHSYTDAQGLIPFLLEREGDKLVERAFRGYSIREYRLHPGAAFQLSQSLSGPGVILGNELALEGWQIGAKGSGEATSTPTLAAGGQLWAVLAWRLEAPVNAGYKAGLTLLDSQGHVAAQSDGIILHNMDPTSRWLPGERARSYFIVPVFPGVAPGEYRLRLQVYDDGRSGQPEGPVSSIQHLGEEVNLGKVMLTTPSGPPVEFSSQDMGNPSVAQLGPIQGLGYTLAKRQFQPGEAIALTLFLKTVVSLGRDYQFRFELRDRLGMAQWVANVSPIFPSSRWRPGDGVRDWQDLVLPGRLAPGEYRLWMGLASSTGAADLPWDLGMVRVQDRPRLYAAPPIANPVKVELEGKAALLGYDLEGDLRPGSILKLTLYWQALKAIDESYTVFAHLLDRQNRIWAQHDSIPAGDNPTSGWLEGEVVVDKHILTIRGDAQPGDYVLEVGMYDAISGKRLYAGATEARVVDGALWLKEVALR